MVTANKTFLCAFALPTLEGIALVTITTLPFLHIPPHKNIQYGVHLNFLCSENKVREARPSGCSVWS